MRGCVAGVPRSYVQSNPLQVLFLAIPHEGQLDFAKMNFVTVSQCDPLVLSESSVVNSRTVGTPQVFKQPLSLSHEYLRMAP